MWLDQISNQDLWLLSQMQPTNVKSSWQKHMCLIGHKDLMVYRHIFRNSNSAVCILQFPRTPHTDRETFLSISQLVSTKENFCCPRRKFFSLKAGPHFGRSKLSREANSKL